MWWAKKGCLLKWVRASERRVVSSHIICAVPSAKDTFKASRMVGWEELGVVGG